MDALKRLKMFRQIRSDMKDPQKVYDDLLYLLNNLGQRILGMDVLNLEFSFVNRRYIFLLFIMTSFLYADIEASFLADDVGEFAYNIAVLGFGLQGFAKFDAYVFRKKDMRTLAWQGSAILAKHKSNHRLNQIMMDSMTYNIILSKFYSVIYATVLVAMSLFGVITSIFSGKPQLSFGFQFSFIDTSRWSGFIFTYFYQVVSVIMVIVSSYCNDNFIVITFVNVLAMFDCIMSDLKELGKLSQLEKSAANQRAAKVFMNAIIRQHQEVIEYLNLSNSVFSLYFMMSLACMTGTIVVLLTALVWLHWWPALVIIGVASFQIFVLCLLGTLLLLKSEELILEVYNTPWHDLDVSVQHSLKLFLMMSQSSKEISYRFGVMNMETYVQSHKLVYSFFTMLITTQE